MKNLISMTDFVLSDEWDGLDESNFIMIMEYAKFLKKPLELWMFVPCDKDGNVLEEPKNYTTWLVLHESKGSTIGFKEHEKYQQAKERCLFYSQHGVDELFDTSLAKVFLDEFCSIEELSNNIRNIQLTQTAIKQIGL